MRDGIVLSSQHRETLPVQRFGYYGREYVLRNPKYIMRSLYSYNLAIANSKNFRPSFTFN